MTEVKVSKADRDRLAARYRELAQPGLADVIALGEMDDHPNLLMLTEHRHQAYEEAAKVAETPFDKAVAPSHKQIKFREKIAARIRSLTQAPADDGDEHEQG